MAITKKFTTEFNPSKLGAFVLPTRIKSEFTKGLGKDYLFYGPPGVGKSSLAKHLASRHPYKYVNVSMNGKIENLRGAINDFCVESQLALDESIDYSKKVVLFDEIDGASSAFFDGLRGFMDDYSENTIFIATCNYFNEIPEAVKSRFECINFYPASEMESTSMKNALKLRLKAIVNKKMESEIDEDALDLLASMEFPDMRYPLKALQTLYIKNVKNIKLEDVTQKSYEFSELYQLIIKGGEAEEIYKMLMGEYANSSRDVLRALTDNFITYIGLNSPSHKRFVPEILSVVNEHMYMSSFKVDQSTNMRACVFKLMKAMKVPLT